MNFAHYIISALWRIFKVLTRKFFDARYVGQENFA